MIDVNDNAKAAVREFARYIGQSDKCERYLEHVSTKKTVADAVEQEGEKWTHTYTHFQPCRIEIEKPDEHGCIVIYVHGDGYITCGPEDIKPIKPTMTEAQQKMVAKFVARIYIIDTSHNLIDEFDKFCNEHEII